MIRFTFRALLPPADGLPGVGEGDLRGFVRRFNREAAWTYWLGIVAGCAIFVLAPPITIGVPLPAFLLPAATLDRYADAVTSHRIYLVRAPILLVKMAAGMAWGFDPKLRAALALDPMGPDPGTWRTT